MATSNPVQYIRLEQFIPSSPGSATEQGQYDFRLSSWNVYISSNASVGLGLELGVGDVVEVGIGEWVRVNIGIRLGLGLGFGLTWG